jgi:hypothetical protein
MDFLKENFGKQFISTGLWPLHVTRLVTNFFLWG